MNKTRITNKQIAEIRDTFGVGRPGLVVTCNAALMGTRGCKGAREYLANKYLCDKCDAINPRWNESNYCAKCSADFQARTLLNPECSPVGSAS